LAQRHDVALTHAAIDARHRAFDDFQAGNHHPSMALLAVTGGIAMRTFLGMILGAVLLVAGVYVYDSMATSTVASGPIAQTGRTIVNWDVASNDWNAVKSRAHEDWTRLSSK
jgi:3-keto-L-gulonate-6-phosphate decarboxylase